MAILETIRHQPQSVELVNGALVWTTDGPLIEKLHQIVWNDGSTWCEANLWAHQNYLRTSEETVRAVMFHLLAYARWLENESVDWWSFPDRESDRCLHRFRGHLIKGRNAGNISASVASARMGAVIRFYRWLQRRRYLVPANPMWVEKVAVVHWSDNFGFNHSIQVATTDLAIPNRKVAGSVYLEDGVMPVSEDDAQSIIKSARNHASLELQLILCIGFLTGLRLGSICDLKIGTIHNGVDDPLQGWHRISVGPGACPPVRTKFSVTGKVPIPLDLIEELKRYATSTRRLKRQALASSQDRELLFLTRSGKPYGGGDHKAVNMAMTRFKQRAGGLPALNGFYIHRTRATFATTLMRAALKFLPVPDAVDLVRSACLHKNDKTTLAYVKLLETSKVASEVSNAFYEAFSGLTKKIRHDQSH